MPDLTGLIAIAIIAFLGGLLVIPCCYFSRRRKDHLQSKRASLGWAIIDAYQTMLLIGFTGIGIWLARRFATNEFIALAIGFGPFIVGVFLFARTEPPVARIVMRLLRA